MCACSAIACPLVLPTDDPDGDSALPARPRGQTPPAHSIRAVPRCRAGRRHIRRHRSPARDCGVTGQDGGMPALSAVRVATLEDLDALTRLRQVWTDETGTHEDPSFPARFRAWFDQESARRTFWLVELDGTAVGTGNLVEYERMPRPAQPAGRWGYLGNLFVLADVRNRG